MMNLSRISRLIQFERCMITRAIHTGNRCVFKKTAVFAPFLAHSSNNLQANVNFQRYNSQDSTMAVPIPIVQYEEIIDLKNHPEKLLVDVREPHEVADGKIPLSINVPLNDVQKAFSTDISDAEFFEKYGHKKPTKSTNIICSCRSGARSEKAANILLNLGYKDVYNYKGSWLEYSARQAEKES